MAHTGHYFTYLEIFTMIAPNNSILSECSEVDEVLATIEARIHAASLNPWIVETNPQGDAIIYEEESVPSVDSSSSTKSEIARFPSIPEKGGCHLVTANLLVRCPEVLLRAIACYRQNKPLPNAEFRDLEAQLDQAYPFPFCEQESLEQIYSVDGLKIGTVTRVGRESTVKFILNAFDYLSCVLGSLKFIQADVISADGGKLLVDHEDFETLTKYGPWHADPETGEWQNSDGCYAANLLLCPYPESEQIIYENGPDDLRRHMMHIASR